MKYLAGVLDACRQKNLFFTGMDIIIDGNLPVGAGLSSSSALTCGFLLGLNALYNWQISKDEMILMASHAEYQMGLQGSLMDQTAIMFGKKDHLILLDNQTGEKTYIKAELEDYELILLDSGVSHTLVDSLYNQRRRESELVPSLLSNINPGLLSLRNVSLEMLMENKTILPPVPFQRAMFVAKENNRVLEAAKALQNKDFSLLGDLMYASHEGLKNEYEVSCPELDYLVDETKAMKEVMGARMMGGGFGGCTLNLLKKNSGDQLIEKINSSCFGSSIIKYRAYKVQLSEAASITRLKR